jgi:formylglycine-generating enzyme required for sulfatase activity
MSKAMPIKPSRSSIISVGLLLVSSLSFAQSENTNAPDDMQPISIFSIDRTEVTIGQFAHFVNAKSFVTKAERDGGGLVYGFGWEQQTGWTWRTPFGTAAQDDEPAVHINFDEAQAYCAWSGKRLPTEAEWVEAAFTEKRE